MLTAIGSWWQHRRSLGGRREERSSIQSVSRSLSSSSSSFLSPTWLPFPRAQCEAATESSSSTSSSFDPTVPATATFYFVFGFPECPWFRRAACIAEGLTIESEKKNDATESTSSDTSSSLVQGEQHRVFGLVEESSREMFSYHLRDIAAVRQRDRAERDTLMQSMEKEERQRGSGVNGRNSDSLSFIVSFVSVCDSMDGYIGGAGSFESSYLSSSLIN